MDKIVYFLRHGQAESNARHFFAGHSDVPLTELGIQQAKDTAPILAHIVFDKVYCSDLQRARNTAALALPHYTCEYTKEIREVDVGALAYQPTADCEKKYGDLYWQCRKKRDYSPFGGESREQFNGRVHGFLNRLAQNDQGPTVAVVCHGGAIQSAVQYVLGDCQNMAQPDNCSITKFSYTNGVWKLEAWNVTAKL
ncbi:MAG: histidine phosphatase family protein [Clostridia bacterium]|nr:histidine phosphatase family protein [Clostridia bacterium]